MVFGISAILLCPPPLYILDTFFGSPVHASTDRSFLDGPCRSSCGLVERMRVDQRIFRKSNHLKLGWKSICCLWI